MANRSEFATEHRVFENDEEGQNYTGSQETGSSEEPANTDPRASSDEAQSRLTGDEHENDHVSNHPDPLQSSVDWNQKINAEREPFDPNYSGSDSKSAQDRPSGMKDDDTAGHAQSSSGESDRSSARSNGETDERAAGDNQTASDRSATVERLEEHNDYRFIFNPNYAAPTSGLEYLKAAADDVNARLNSKGLVLENIVDLSEERRFNFLGLKFGRSEQHRAIDAATAAFKNHGEHSSYDRNMMDAVGVADAILSKYQITYENLEAAAAYKQGGSADNPGMITGGERDVMAHYHGQLRDAFKDYANGDSTHAQANQRALNAIDNLENYLKHIRYGDADGSRDLGSTVDQMRGMQFPGQQPDTQHNFQQLDQRLNFHQMDEWQKFPGMLQDRLDQLPHTADGKNGFQSIKDAFNADYAQQNDTFERRGDLDLAAASHRYEAMLEQIKGMDFQPINIEKFSDGQLSRLMQGLADPETHGYDSFYSAFYALGDEADAAGNRTKWELANIMSVQAGEYWRNDDGSRDRERALDNLSAIDSIMQSNPEAARHWGRFLDQQQQEFAPSDLTESERSAFERLASFTDNNSTLPTPAQYSQFIGNEFQDLVRDNRINDHTALWKDSASEGVQGHLYSQFTIRMHTAALADHFSHDGEENLKAIYNDYLNVTRQLENTDFGRFDHTRLMAELPTQAGAPDYYGSYDLNKIQAFTDKFDDSDFVAITQQFDSPAVASYVQTMADDVKGAIQAGQMYDMHMLQQVNALDSILRSDENTRAAWEAFVDQHAPENPSPDFQQQLAAHREAQMSVR